MEQIRQAVERAKEGDQSDRLRALTAPHGPPSTPESPVAAPSITGSDEIPVQATLKPGFGQVNLSLDHLEQHRIVAHSVADPRSKSFDMLRTQLLQAMDQKNWQFLAVTSPTAGCGKTVTAINLALSIARQPERSALLVDMDLQRPAVAKYLGLNCRQGLVGILEGRTTPAAAAVRAQIDGNSVTVLPTETSTVRSSELIASRMMNALLQEIRRTYKNHIVIFDMPPLLSGDDVIAMLPRIDCVLLVAATGQTTLHQVMECNRHLQSAEVVRLVLNKSHESTDSYYY